MAYRTSLALLTLVCSSVWEASAEEQTKISDENGGATKMRRPVSNPVSNLFSQLGGLFLDMDETLSKQMAPKVNVEDEMMARLLRGIKIPNADNFKSVQKNYEILQRRIGETLNKNLFILQSPKGSKDARPTAETTDGKISVISAPYDSSNINNPNSSGIPEPDKDLPNVFERKGPGVEQNFPEIEVSKVDDQVIDESVFGDFVDNPETFPAFAFSEGELHKRTGEDTTEETPAENPPSRRIPSDLHLKRIRARLSHEARLKDMIFSKYAPKVSSRQGSILVSSNEKIDPEGRILGDVLYSEQTYDDHLRRFMDEHAYWLLNSPLLLPKGPSKPTSETPKPQDVPKVETATKLPHEPHSTESEPGVLPVTEFAIQTDESTINSRNRKINPEYLRNYYRISKRNGEELQNILILGPISSQFSENLPAEDEFGQQLAESKDTLILAFTSDGVPLKLKFGPEIENPIKFLHKTLSAAGVSLNIPIESYDDIEPAGNEVLQLGAGAGGIITRALYIDLSNTYEMKSLLRSLRKAKRLPNISM